MTTPRPPRSPADVARGGWIALGLSVIAPLNVLLNLAGANLGPLSFLAVPALIAAVVLAIIALKRGAQPRWPSILALVLAALYVVGFIIFAAWALVGMIQIIMLSSN